MQRYKLIILLSSILLVVIITTLLMLVYGKKKEKTKIKKRKNIYKRYSLKTIIYILLGSVATTYFLSSLSRSEITSAVIFLTLVGLTPIMLSNIRKRLKQEAIFNDVILYCQNTGMLIKQTHNVYDSIKKTMQDLDSSLGEDLKGLLLSLEEGKEKTKEAMEIIETNYPFSCIKNLDVIILHMFFENSKITDSLIDTYLDDISVLESDVRENKQKRKSMKLTYIFITVASVLTYAFFVTSLSKSYVDIFNNDRYIFMNALYLFGTIIAFFFVDRYFNLNTTKE